MVEHLSDTKAALPIMYVSPKPVCFEPVARKGSGSLAEQQRSLGRLRRPLPPQSRPVDRGQGGERWQPHGSLTGTMFVSAWV